jgi:sulfonate transport system substrate-binding protein
VLAGRNEFLEKNPEVAVALEKALIRAYDFANENPDKAYQDFTLDNKYTVDLIKKVYSENNGGNGQFEFGKGNIEEEDLKKLSGLSEFLYSHEIITNQVDIKDFVNTKYYEQALKELK